MMKAEWVEKDMEFRIPAGHVNQRSAANRSVTEKERSKAALKVP